MESFPVPPPAGPPAGGSGTLRPSVDDVLADVVRHTGASIGGVFLTEPGGEVLRLTTMCGLPPEFAAPWKRVPTTDSVPITDAIRRDGLVWIGSQEDMARAYPRAAAVLPYRFALAAVPLAGAQRCWGALLLLWPASHPREPSVRERGHIVSSGRRLGRVLDEVGGGPLPEEPRVVPLNRAEPGGSMAQGAAGDFAERLPGAAALDLEGRFTYVSVNAAALLGRPVEQLLGTRPWQSLPWLDHPVYEDHYRTAVVGREPITYGAVRPPDRPIVFRLFPDGSGISVLITPGSEQDPPAEVPRRAEGAATASTGRLYQLVHLAAALTETVGVRDVVDLVAAQVLPAFAAQGLIIYSAEAGRLAVMGSHGYPADMIERLDFLTVDTELTPAGRALSNGAPCFFRNRGELIGKYPRALTLSDKNAWAFLPLVVSRRPVGCCILSYNQPHDFSADERAVLTSLSGLLAQALDRARLFDAKQAVAQDLQRALLPRALPRLPGLEVGARYLPASHGLDVGGDFYDLIRLSDDTSAAVIGDVQGHSIAAAALMGQVRTAVHAHSAAGARPDQILARTGFIMADLEPDLLVSCLYAHLDFAHDCAVIASAGHLPPLLRRPGQSAAPVPLEPGPLLGVDSTSTYPATTIELPPGSLLALYTDGLVETPGADLDLATAALARVLTEADLNDLDHVIDALLHQGRPNGQYLDDIAVLLAHRLPGTPSP